MQNEKMEIKDYLVLIGLIIILIIFIYWWGGGFMPNHGFWG